MNKFYKVHFCHLFPDLSYFILFALILLLVSLNKRCFKWLCE